MTVAAAPALLPTSEEGVMPTGCGESLDHQFLATMTSGRFRDHDFAQRCRTRSILADFGEEAEQGWRCGDGDACDPFARHEAGGPARAA